MCSCPNAGAGNVKAMGSSRFAYDALSRLTEARVVANGSTYTQTVQVDLFGNITANVTTTFGSRATPTQTWSNHLSSGTYNPAGSLTSWNLWGYDWDRVEMMRRRSTTGQDWRFVYTAGDERFWGVNISNWETSDFTLRDLDGRVLRVYEAAGNRWSRLTDYVWRGDALLARDFSYTRPEAFHLDHLGTPRLLTNHRAERLAQPNYYPFGEEITVNTQVAERLKFTGHERDTLGTPGVADDLDYMHARFANPITGRFLSVDSSRRSFRTAEPQSWNRYQYGLSNPLKFVDPDGADVILANRPVNPFPFAYHAFIIVQLTGENRKLFAERADSRNRVILSADQGWVDEMKRNGLVKVDSDSMNQKTQLIYVQPADQTKEQFERNVIRAWDSYVDGSAKYDNIATPPAKNSNSLASGVLDAAGLGANKPSGWVLKGWNPGWGKPVALPDATCVSRPSDCIQPSSTTSP